MSESAEFFTPEQLAARWHMEAKTLRNWRAARKGPPYIKIGSKILYPVEGVHAHERIHSSWLAQSQSPGTSAETQS